MDSLRKFNRARRTWRAAINATLLIGGGIGAEYAPADSASDGTKTAAPDAETVSELRAAFATFDTDVDGRVSLREMSKVRDSAEMRRAIRPEMRSRAAGNEIVRLWLEERS